MGSTVHILVRAIGKRIFPSSLLAFVEGKVHEFIKRIPAPAVSDYSACSSRFKRVKTFLIATEAQISYISLETVLIHS